MDFKTSQRKCLNDQFDSCCDKSHFMRQLSDSASDFFYCKYIRLCGYMAPPQKIRYKMLRLRVLKGHDM